MRLFQLFATALAVMLLFAGPAAADAAHAVLNKEGVWGIDVDHGSCVASMTLQNGDIFLLRGTHGQVDVVLFARHELPLGKRGRLETEAYGFDFTPDEGHGGYLTSVDPFDSRDLFALRRAKAARISIDGWLVADVTLEGTGFPLILDELLACARSEKGWWGEGAKPPAKAQ